MNEVHEKANAAVIYLYGAFTRKDYYENLEGILTDAIRGCEVLDPHSWVTSG